MTTLPILTVETNHSRYLIDQNAGTYTRTRVHPDASNLAPHILDDEPVEYSKIYAGPEVGSSLVIVHPDGTWIRSTAVKSILEQQVAA